MSPELYPAMLRAQGAHWWFRVRREAVSEVIARHPRSGGLRLLEIGAGTGANIAMLAGHGRVTALDNDAYALAALAALAASRPGRVEVVPGDAGDLARVAGQRFDVVLLLDVLEHLDDDVAALRQARAALRPGGSLVATVPAHPWLFGEHDRLHRHRRRYTARSLRRALGDAGFGRARMRWMFARSLPLMILSRVLGRRHDVVAEAASPLNRLLYALERGAARHGCGMPGSSLLAVAST
ncbi:MAG TPA: class I SAM-dependent methyltransferase [Planctomycetota bacterium]|nr:class I SAM-dependent methyltransferase [Planctomycetota bacterium]